MRLAKDLVGKPIYTIEKGQLLGKVKDIYLDENLYWMTGIYLGREGMFSRKENLIPRNSVAIFGIDAILVRGEDVVTDNRTHDTNGWQKLSKLRGRAIDTPGGTRLAAVGDVILDGEGHITGFALSKVSIDGPIARDKAISREVVIDNGNQDGVMTIDLGRAEQLGLPAEKPYNPTESDEDVTTAKEPAAESATDKTSTPESD